MNDLERVIATEKEALALTPEDHSNRSTYLNNLEISLQSLFERTGLMHHLNQAIATNDQLLTSTLDDDPDRAMYLNLGSALQSDFPERDSSTILIKRL